jgi:rhamnosyltransferase
VKQIKVLAYITAYEDKKAVQNCVQAIQNQSFPVHKIFIINNSSIEPILKWNYTNIIIEHHPENIGVGAGLNIALDFAQAQGYDFLWTFDQDSIPMSDCLEILLEAYYKLSTQYNIAIIAPTPIDIRTNAIIEGAVFSKYCFTGCKHNHKTDFYECDSPITSGSLISVEKAKTVSAPRADFFIDGIDLDYGLRLKQKGYANLIITKATIQHQFGYPSKIVFLQRQINIHKYSALRHYYICRNHTYLEMKHSHGWQRLFSFKHRIKYTIYSIAKILLFDDEQKLTKIKACLLGTYHGLISQLGKVSIGEFSNILIKAPLIKREL